MASTVAAVPTRRRLRSKSGGVLAGLVVAALASVALYLLIDLPAAWEYVLGLRLRTVAGMVVVATSVGASTVVFQTITANRILTPGIMGFDAIFVALQTVVVAVLGIGAVTALQGPGAWALEVCAMAGAIVLLYRWLFVGRRLDLHLLVLVGLVLGTFIRSVTSFLQRMLDPVAFAVVQDASFASFTSVDAELLPLAALVVAAGLALLWPIRRSLDPLSLGEPHAIGLGVEHRRVVMTVVVSVALMVAGATGLAGPVTFFGLLVANLAYTLVGHRHARSIPAAVALSVIILVGGQLLLDRVFGFGTALPIIIEFAGGVVFIALVLTGRAR